MVTCVNWKKTCLPLVLIAGVIMMLIMSPGFVLGQEVSSVLHVIVKDPAGNSLPGAVVTLESLELGKTLELQTNERGECVFQPLLPSTYKVLVKQEGFETYIQEGLEVPARKESEIMVQMVAGQIEAEVTVKGNISVRDKKNAEVSNRFDTQKIADIPLGTDRSIYSILSSSPGVVSFRPDQGFSNQEKQSVNGGRPRANTYSLDGLVTNSVISNYITTRIQFPDIIKEVKVITNNFSPDTGRSSSLNSFLITKNGTNDLHGSVFYFNANDRTSSLSNTDKLAGNGKPSQNLNYAGGVIGGPILKDKAWFFGGFQYVKDSRSRDSVSFLAPTPEGVSILSQIANTPVGRYFLSNLPLPQTGTVDTRTVTVNGETYTIPFGLFSAVANANRTDKQYFIRGDSYFGENLKFSTRFYKLQSLGNSGQVAPEFFSGRERDNPFYLLNDLTYIKNWGTLSFLYGIQRLNEGQDLANEAARTPLILLPDLGYDGTSGNPIKTSIGSPLTYPASYKALNHQLGATLTYNTPVGEIKSGVTTFIQRDTYSLLFNSRGFVFYDSLQGLVDDSGFGFINKRALENNTSDFRGSQTNVFAFAQHKWQPVPNVVITYGVRYEHFSNFFNSLEADSQKILASTNLPPGYDYQFKSPQDFPHDFQPRIGVAWNIQSQNKVLKFLLGQDKTTLRTGFAKTQNALFHTLGIIPTRGFPFVNSFFLNDVGTFDSLANPRPGGLEDFYNVYRANSTLKPATTYQTSLELQREIAANYIVKASYIFNRGVRLLQSLDGNPVDLVSRQRANEQIGAVLDFAASGSSTYHGLNLSLEKRFSDGFSGSLHYTWSSLIDSNTDVFEFSLAESAVAQNHFDRRADRSKSALDRTQRLVGNFVYALPYRNHQGLRKVFLDDWHVNGLITLQSGAPFNPQLDDDPTGGLFTGLYELIYFPFRLNSNTDINLSKLTVKEIFQLGPKNLFTPPTNEMPFGSLGRNNLRSDGFANLDLGIVKNFSLTEDFQLQLRADIYNLTNTRNYGIPNAFYYSPTFLDEGKTNGGNRQILFGVRFIF